MRMSLPLALWANTNTLPPIFPLLENRFMSSLVFFHFPGPLDVSHGAALKWDTLTKCECSCRRTFVAG